MLVWSAVTEASSDDCVARLCHLKIWPDFAGYGFNLHADRATPGQYVGKVDESSPAEAAGLKLNDRIVEVNGRSVDGKSHAEVVTDIKSISGKVRLLVVDAAADAFYRDNGVKISSESLTNIHDIICPDSRPQFNTGPIHVLLITYYWPPIPHWSHDELRPVCVCLSDSLAPDPNSTTESHNNGQQMAILSSIYQDGPILCQSHCFVNTSSVRELSLFGII